TLMDPQLCTIRFCSDCPRALHSFPTRRSSDLAAVERLRGLVAGDRVQGVVAQVPAQARAAAPGLQVGEVDPVVGRLVPVEAAGRSEEHTSELQSRENLVCRLLLEKKKKKLRL